MSLSKPTLLLVAAFTFLSSLVIPIVSAQQTQNGGSGLQISPTRTELTAEPGEQKSFTVNLRNVTQADITAKVSLNDFESDNESGTPKIIVDQKDKSPYSVSSMLKGLQDVDLKPGEVKEVKIGVEVPVGSAPGAYFGALRYAAIPKGLSEAEAQRQVALTASVAHLVFIEVPGDVNQQIQVENLKAGLDNKSGSFFIKTPNKSFLTVKNLGNGFSRPFGQVSVKNPFGKEVHTYQVNNTDPRGIVLPQSSRTFVDDLKKVEFPGKYKMTASVAYGNGGEVVNYTSSFWYMPIWFLVILLVLVVAIIIGLYTLYRRRYVGNSKTRKQKKRRK